MCGISGIIGKCASQKQLENMLIPIRHRGELNYRDSMVVLDQKMAIGMHRLAIHKEDDGHQPFANANKTVYCVFNGEIYNYQKLSEQLLSAGSRSTMLSEVQIILEAYLHWGIDFVKRLDGKFAVAIIDLNTKNTILARDYMGVKPLYYQQKGENILFSSEIKSFIGDASSQAVEGGSILSLKPGCYLSYGIEYQYIDRPKLNLSQPNNNSYPLLYSLKNSLEQAVEKRIGRAPVACLLSGGIDSSIIAYIASKYNKQLHAYTLGLDNSPDLEASRLLCKELNIKHTVITPKKEDLQNFYLKEGVYMTESYEPTLVRNAISYYHVCKIIARDGFKYALTGEGADELFGGYDFVMNASDKDKNNLIQYSLDVISNTYLQMVDRAAMRVTLEVRVPYMDKDLVNFVKELPIHYRIDKKDNKIALRKLYADSLPVEICERKKLGMNHGSGFGVNDTKSSIYYEAVENHYNKFTDRLNQDEVTVDKYKDEFKIDSNNLEEVYNFARYVEFGYIAYSDRSRYQLNGLLRPEIQSIIDNQN